MLPQTETLVKAFLWNLSHFLKSIRFLQKISNNSATIHSKTYDKQPLFVVFEGISGRRNHDLALFVNIRIIEISV